MAVITSDDQSYKDQIQANDKVIVKFYADWCGSCKLFKPKFKRLSNEEGNADVVFLDVNAEENPAFRKDAGVNNLPSFVIYKGGELIETVATNKEDAVVEMINKLKA